MGPSVIEQDGPWVQSALICEQIIVPPDGVPTIVRVLDRLSVTLQPLPSSSPPAVPPDRMPPVEFPLTLTLILRSTRSLQGELSIDVTTPDGGRYLMMARTAVFSGTPPAFRGNIQANIIFGLSGLYWFDVTFGGQLLTRVPLEVIYAPQPVAGRAPP